MPKQILTPDDFVNVIKKHPYFTKPDGEISREDLETWIKKQISLMDVKKLNPEEIDEILLQCENLEIINIKRYPQGTLITPTKKFSSWPKHISPLVVNEDKKSKSMLEVSKSGFIKNNYAQLLLDNINKFPETSEQNIYLPFFYELISNIINDLYTDWHTKLMLSSSLGYIILQEDVIPDYHPDGYIDDLYVLAYCLRETKEHNSKHIIQNNWNYSDEIFSLIDNVCFNCEKKLGDKCDIILHKIGLKKFKNLEMVNYSSGVFKTLEFIQYEKRLLIKLVGKIIGIARKKCGSLEIEEIEKILIESPDYDEIIKEQIYPSPISGAPVRTSDIIKTHISSLNK